MPPQSSAADALVWARLAAVVVSRAYRTSLLLLSSRSLAGIAKVLVVGNVATGKVRGHAMHSGEAK